MISEFPLFVFTALGSMAAGAYVAVVLFPLGNEKRSWLVKLVCLICLVVGGIALMFHLGHPERVLNAFANPAAGITLEAYSSILFGLFLFIDVIVEKVKKHCVRPIAVIGAIGAVLLALAMGYAYHQYLSNAVWGNWPTIVMFLVTGFAAGTALPALFERALYEKGGFKSTVLVFQVLAALVSLVMAVYFGVFGYGADSIVLAVAACVLFVVACALVAAKKLAAKSLMPIVVFVLVFVALICLRIAFYNA